MDFFSLMKLRRIRGVRKHQQMPNGRDGKKRMTSIDSSRTTSGPDYWTFYSVIYNFKEMQVSHTLTSSHTFQLSVEVECQAGGGRVSVTSRSYSSRPALSIASHFINLLEQQNALSRHDGAFKLENPLSPSPHEEEVFSEARSWRPLLAPDLG